MRILHHSSTAATTTVSVSYQPTIWSINRERNTNKVPSASRESKKMQNAKIDCGIFYPLLCMRMKLMPS